MKAPVLDGRTPFAKMCCTPWALPRGERCILLRERTLILMGKPLENVATPPGACAGRSLFEMIEDVLDERFDRLKSPETEDEDRAKLAGEAMGLSIALSILRNPYFPNVDSVKAEAVERYEARTGVE